MTKTTRISQERRSAFPERFPGACPVPAGCQVEFLPEYREECSAFPAPLQGGHFRVQVVCPGELHLECREECDLPDAAWAQWVPDNSDRDREAACLEGEAPVLGQVRVEANEGQRDQVAGASRALAE